MEDFGLETEPTSDNCRNQMKFQVSSSPAALPHSRRNFVTNGWQGSPESFEIRLFDILRFRIHRLPSQNQG